MVTRRKNRLTTDAFREIRNTFSRYVSILVLAALAVAFLAGLRTAAPDMQYTADNYYDRTRLMDGYVLSTLGLTEADLAALEGAEGVETAEGCRDLDAVATDRIVNVRSLPERLNLLEATQGRLPQSADECVTENLLLVKLGLEVGDRLELTLEPDNEGDLVNTSYTIVGVVSSPLYVALDRGASSLGNGSVDAFVYVPGENFTFEHYTCAYFTGEGLAALDTYGGEYEDRIDALVDSLDPLADQRAQLRYNSLIGDAQAELDDARREFEEAKAEAEQELADAWQELQDARQELDDGWAEYRDGEDTLARETADAEQELADALTDLREAEQKLADGRTEYQEGLAEYEDGLAKYEEGLAEYNDGWAEYQNGLSQYQRGRMRYREGLADYEKGKADYDEARDQYEAGRRLYESGLADYRSGLAAYQSGLAEYQSNLERYQQLEALLPGMEAQAAQLEQALAQLTPGTPEYIQAQAQLDALRAQLSGAEAAKRELEAAKAQLDQAKAELDSAPAELESAKAELE